MPLRLYLAKALLNLSDTIGLGLTIYVAVRFAMWDHHLRTMRGISPQVWRSSAWESRYFFGGALTLLLLLAVLLRLTR